jgi:hypothetical protein
MGRRDWFELSHEGWQRLSMARPLGRLLLEAVQNSFDGLSSSAGATSVSVTLRPESIAIEDDARGIDDESLVYTVFLSGKAEEPTKRGRMGRGLKELIAAMDAAEVETTRHTVRFGPEGRFTESNTRERGTRLVLKRRFGEAELREAETWLRLTIPPPGVTLRIDGKLVRRPKALLTLSSCELETVIVQDAVERIATRPTEISLYRPRRGEDAHLLEMGIPIERWDVPWHVDVHQRVPLNQGRDSVPDRFKLALRAALLEAMIHSYLDKNDLRADWAQEVVARAPLRASVLDAYVSKVFPRGAVLGGTSRANDRARQLGAHVIEGSSISHGSYLALSRVLETSDEYVRRRAAEFEGEPIEPDQRQLAFAEAVRWLARRIAGRVVRVSFFARDPNDAGLLEDAHTDVDAKVISFNVRGPARFDDILDPQTLGLVLHEIAHLESPEHDHRFIDRLQYLAGQTARVLSDGGPELARMLRAGDPERRRS